MQQMFFMVFAIGISWSLVEGKPFQNWLVAEPHIVKKDLLDGSDGFTFRKVRHAANSPNSMELIELPWIACKDRSRASGYCGNEGKCEERFVPMRRQGQKHYRVEELFRCICKDGFTGVRCETTTI